MKKPPAKPILETALDALAKREHSTQELKRKLLQKGYPQAEISQTLAQLQAKNQLSDARYAAARLRYRATVSRWGLNKIRQELTAQGVTPTLITEAITGAEADGINFADSAKTLAKRANPLPKMTAADPALGRREQAEARQKAKEKLLAKLLRKGFSFAEAKAAIEEMPEE